MSQIKTKHFHRIPTYIQPYSLSYPNIYTCQQQSVQARNFDDREGKRAGHLLSKNQLLRFPPPVPPAPPFTPSCDCKLVKTGFVGPSPPLMKSEPEPPPRKGFAMREPVPPKLNPPEGIDGERPRVEPSLAASSRSLTAESWSSKLKIS